MDLTRRRKLRPSVDMTPMIDCVFQLLVFFLLTSAFRAPAVDLILPSGATTEPPRPEEVIVELDSNQILFVNSRSTTLAGLPASVREAIRNISDPTITVRAHGKLEYEQVMKVMLATRAAGVRKVQLAYEPESPK